MQQLAHKLGRGYDLKEEQELLETEAGGGMRRHGSNMRLSRGDLADSSADNEAQVSRLICITITCPYNDEIWQQIQIILFVLLG